MSSLNAEELAQTLFEESGDALFLFDPDLEQLLDVNPMAQRLSGYARSELLKMQVTYLFRSEVQGALHRLRAAFRKTGLFHSQEGYYLRNSRDGVWIPVNLTITRLHLHPRPLGLITARDVREQRVVYNQLKQTEERLRRVINNAPVVLFAVDPSGTFTMSEGRGLTGLGLKPGEVVGQSAFEVYKHTPAVVASLRRVLAGETFTATIEFLAGPGAGLFFETHLTPLYDNEGKVSGAIGIATDITENRRSERALQAGERQLRAVFENAQDAMTIFDDQGQYVEVNPAACALHGLPREQLLGRRADEFLGPGAEFGRAWRAFLEKGRETGEYRLVRPDGLIRDVEYSAVAHFLPGRHLSVGRDVTERKRAEQSLLESEARYRTLIENLEQSVFLKDRNLRFVAVNRQFCAAVNCPEAEILGKTDFDFYPPAMAEKYRADDESVLAEGRRLEIEDQTLIAGQVRTVRVVKTPVRDALGQPVGVLGIFWDITDQRALEAQLRQAQKMEAVGQLAGGVAHDFNNLLTAILGNVSLVLAGSPEGDPDRESLAAAERAALRAAELTSQLLGFSRKTLLRPQPTDLNALTREVVSILRRTVDPRIQVEVRAAPDLWLVYADSGQVNQVLMNLCLNARDAMPDGGKLLLETANVTLGPDQVRHNLDARPGEFVRLRVEDTGGGIPPEIRARIFEPFFTTKGPGKGTGLGLAMVFGIVQQHRGWVVCTSEVGLGTCFDIFLPRHLAAQPAPSAVAAPVTSPRGGNETILLVDDEPMIRNLGRMILAQYGYRVLLAADGLEAIEVYQRHRSEVALVILDLMMPRLSGRETFQRLLELDPQAHVLFASGYSAEHVTASEHERSLGFVGKPYRPEELAQAVRTALDSLRGG